MLLASVAIIIPSYNEALYMDALLVRLAAMAPGQVDAIIVVDGGSTDGTREIVEFRAATDARVKLVDNPARLQAAGINRAVAGLPPTVKLFIRVDAHADYPPDFVDALLAEQAASGAQSVVNQLRTMGTACFQRAVAAASNSPFGTGGATHRVGGRSRFVDHGHHALFDRATFVELGGYDERFFANEDAEYDARLRATGGRVWFTNRATVGYYPRPNPAGLARQYFRYGRGRAMTRAKHGEPLRARQLAPACLTALLLFAVLASPMLPFLLLLPVGYLLATTAAAMLLAVKARDTCVLGAAVALPIMHIVWGVGFLIETATRRAGT